MIACQIRGCQSSAMSYYNPGQPGTYPYGYTPATYTQTPGSYASYSYPPTAVTGYGTTWPYYSYVPPQHRTTTTTAVPRTTATSSTTTGTANRGTSFATTHTPASYADTINAAGGSGNTRTGGLATGSKRQANLKGLFTKECELDPQPQKRARRRLFLRSAEFDVWVWRRPEPCQRYGECNGRDIDRIHRGCGEWPKLFSITQAEY